MTDSTPGTKKVVIVGGGFGGLQAAKRFRRDPRFSITIIDRQNYHLFQPLLYQVATASLSPAEIAFPIRTIFSRDESVQVLLGEVEDVDLPNRNLVTSFGRISYDFLVLACGATHTYFGHESWEPNAPGLKTLEQATEIRRRILFAFEMAEREKDPAIQKDWLTFVVVGGGPTGVELAGALGEISRYTLTHEFRNIDPKQTRIFLIEGGPRVLAAFPTELSQKAVRALEKLGVQVWTSSRVTGVDEQGVQVAGERIASKTVIWAAGVKPSPINQKLSQQFGLKLDRMGRITVNEDLSLPGFPEVFAVGDQVCFPPEGLPGIAPVAIQQGRAAAQNIIRSLDGKEREKFHYREKGMMATIGRSQAIALIGHLWLTGWAAWVSWLLIHIYYLIGFRNRLLVLTNWAWNYFSFKRGARLIVGKKWRLFSDE